MRKITAYERRAEKEAGGYLRSSGACAKLLSSSRDLLCARDGKRKCSRPAPICIGSGNWGAFMEKRATLLAMILCAVQPFTAHAAMSLEGEHQCAVFNAAIDESQATVDMNLRLVAKFQARKSELGCGGGAATGAGDRRCANLTDGISDAQAAAEREKRILAKFKARRSELACTGAESLANSGGEPKKWVDTGFGDCPGQDVGLTSGPVPAEGMCTEDKAGRFAVCWDGKRFKNGYGEKHGAPGYPWCTYKATTSCGGGKNTGRLFKCSPETR